MKRYKHRWYESPIDLPAATSGTTEIRHRVIPAGEWVPIVGQRQAFLRGIRPVHAMLERPLRVHELYAVRHGVWMTDLPEELNQIAEMLYVVHPQKQVLVGGLGLGILATMVAVLPGVKDVTVIEANRDVIALCARPGYETVHGYVQEYLTTDEVSKFDYYLLDTWTGTSEGTWWEEVMPLRRIIRNRWGNKPVIHCWAEDIMVGQLYRTLTESPPHWYTKNLPCPMRPIEARYFLTRVGTKTWEKRYAAALDSLVL